MKRALHYAELGELSHAARELESVGLALGCLSTLAELQDAQLRPSGPAEPINTAPSEGTPLISLERHLFGTVLRIARRGVSAGLSGNRNEFLRVCLDDDISFDALYDVGVIFARGQIPSEIAQFMKLARLTPLIKPNGRIRGIPSGDTFRRLVSKCIAKQNQPVLRKLCEPFNFGICHTGGTDALIHLIQFLLDEDPSRVLLSIDGVGAFDHVCRARIFEELRAHEELRDLLPFVTMWYGTASLF